MTPKAFGPDSTATRNCRSESPKAWAPMGIALEPGQFVSTGTCMVPVEVEAGDQG